MSTEESKCEYIRNGYWRIIPLTLGHLHTAAKYGCQFCIWVHNTVTFTHTERLFKGVTVQDWTSCLSQHRILREPLCCTNAYDVFSCVVSVTYSDGEMSCVSSESLRSSQFSTGAAPVSFMFCAWPQPKFKSCCRLMKIWRKNSRLDRGSCSL